MVGEVEDHVRSTQAETSFTDANELESQHFQTPNSGIEDLDDVATIVKFLSRPRDMGEINIAASDMDPLTPFANSAGAGTRTALASYRLPQAITKGRTDKINNFEWFKCDFVFKFMVNVNPFVAGKLFAYFSPEEDNMLNHCRSLSKSRASLTSYPGVEIDLQSNNSAVLRVPWCGAFDAMSLTSSRGGFGVDVINIGNVHVVPLSELMTADNTVTMSLAVFGWMENIELKGPTPRTVIAQLQGGEAPGPITEVSGKVKRAADLFTGYPVVGSIASTASWVSGVVNRVASIFGWSRPVDGSHAPAVSNIPARGFTNFKAKDNSVVLGMSADNQVVEKQRSFLVDEDEMDIQHICKTPGLIESSRWASGDAPHTVLGMFRVGPSIEQRRVGRWEIVPGEEYRVYDLTLFELLCTKFAQWRADLHFRIDVIKTAFHVGRFEVAFVPGDSMSVEQAAAFDLTNTWRHVVDITETNEIHFTVPYMHRNVMCKSGYDPEEYIEPGRGIGPDGIVGTLIVRSVTKLSAPDSVSPFVQLNVWKHATNVALSCPMGMGLEPIVPTVVRAQLQGAEDSTIAFGNVNKSSSLLDATTTVGGEIIVNLRASTRSHRIAKRNLTDGTLNTLVNSSFGGFVGFCASIFAFYRGGISFKFTPSENSLERQRITTSLIRPDYNGEVPLGNTPTDTPQHITYTDLNPFHEVQVPYYAVSRRSVCNLKLTDNDSKESAAYGQVLRVETTVPLTVLVGAKDDLTFGTLIGPPVYGAKIESPPPS